MPSLLDLIGQMPGIQQTPEGGMPGMMNTDATPIGPGQQPQMPQQMQQPQPPPQPTSLWQRIQQNLMPSPQGLAGLVSEGDVSHARGRGLMDMGLSLLANARGEGGENAPSFGHALQAGVGAMRQGYNTDLNGVAQGNMQGMQMSQQKAILQGRQAIGQFLQKNISGDQAQDFVALRKAYMMAAAIGDADMMKSLSPLLEKDPGLENSPLQAVPAGGQTVMLDPRTHKQVGVIPHTPVPIDASVLEERQARMQRAIAEAQSRGDARLEMQLSRDMQRENTFLDNYRQDPDVKYGTAVAQVAGQLNALRPRALAGEPYAQYQALEAVLRLRNPEMNRQPNPYDYRVLATSMGLQGKVFKALENYQKGTILPKEAMRRLYETSDVMVHQGRERFDAAHGKFSQRLAHWKIDPALIPDVFETIPRRITTDKMNPLMP